MKAALVRELNQPVSIEEVEIDDPRGHEVLVRTVAAGVCHSDFSAIDGTVDIFPRPLVLGHESSGVVEAVGPDVSYCQPGDHVVTCLGTYCGRCAFCQTGRLQLCVGAGTYRLPDEPPRVWQGSQALSQYAGLGSFAEFVLVHENSVARIPKEMPLDRAALLGCGITTGLGSAINTAPVRVGSTVAVVGCGGVGLSIVQGARIAGAQRIIAVDRFKNRLSLALELGATDIIDAASTDGVAEVLKLTGGGVDFAFEAVGNARTTEQAFAMLERGGTAIVVGVVFGMDITLPGTALMAERSIKGSMGGSSRFQLDIPRYADLYLQGRLKLDELVTSHLPLERIDEAFELMHRGEGARSVITFGK